ncbi:MAG: plastocyanin/azurin family copper-binding protein [Nitrosotalea sp.]
MITPSYGEEIPNTNSSKQVTIFIQPPNVGTPYDPKEIHIIQNSIVTWINNDNVSHTVTSGDPQQGADGKFDSGLIKPEKEFSHTFTEIGTFNYYCQVHPAMTGIVIVDANIVPEFPFAAVILVIATLSIVLISRIKQYHI